MPARSKNNYKKNRLQLQGVISMNLGRTIMKKTQIKPFIIGLGASVALSVSVIPVASAASDTLSSQKLSSGYQLADNHMGQDSNNGQGEKKSMKDHQGKCGNGECKDKTKEKGGDGKCGAGKCGS